MKDPEIEIQIENFEIAYRNGTKLALRDCFCFCKEHDLPIPKWAQEEAILFFDAGLKGKATLRGHGRSADPIKTQNLTEEKILRAHLMQQFQKKGENQLVASESAAMAIGRLHEKFPDEIQNVESEQVRKDYYSYNDKGGDWYIRDIARTIREDNLAYFLGAAAAVQMVREYQRTGRWDGLEDFMKLIQTLTGPEFKENRHPPDKKKRTIKVSPLSGPFNYY